MGWEGGVCVAIGNPDTELDGVMEEELVVPLGIHLSHGFCSLSRKLEQAH